MRKIESNYDICWLSRCWIGSCTNTRRR